MSTTWQFKSEELNEVMSAAWEQISGQNISHHQYTDEVLENTKRLPEIENSQNFPYLDTRRKLFYYFS